MDEAKFAQKTVRDAMNASETVLAKVDEQLEQIREEIQKVKKEQDSVKKWQEQVKLNIFRLLIVMEPVVRKRERQ